MASIIQNKMSCGNCGGETFEVFHIVEKGSRFGDSPSHPTRLYILCTSCKSASDITIQQPVMEISIADDGKSEGCLCVMGDNG